MPHPADRKLLIHREAAVLFASRGYEGVTLAEIAGAAGSTVGSLQNFFGSKADLALAVRDSVVTDLAGIIRTALERHPRDVSKAVEGAIAAYMAWAAEHPDQLALLQALANVRLDRGQPGRDILVEISAAVWEWAAPLCKVGTLPALEPAQLYSLILGPAITLCSTGGVQVASDRPSVGQASTLASLVLGGLYRPLDGGRRRDLTLAARKGATGRQASQPQLDLARPP